MNDILPKWLERVHPALTARGMVLTVAKGQQAGNCSVNIDSDHFVGTICYWPENQFEFQFNDCKSGEAIILESDMLYTVDELDIYFADLILKKLRQSRQTAKHHSRRHQRGLDAGI